jgi:predicted HTH domain antitoxin
LNDNTAYRLAAKLPLQEPMRTESILALFADRKITAGKAATELGLDRLALMDLLKRRDIPSNIYTSQDWEADAAAIVEFKRRREDDYRLILESAGE